MVRAPITLLDIQSKVAIACQCNSFPAIISRCFCQHFFIFWGTIFGSHFWAPFLVPRTIFKRKFDWSWFKNGPPFLGPKNCLIFDFFSQKRFSSYGQKTCTCWLSKQPFCTNMHKNLPGIELRWHEGKIIRFLDLTSGTAPSQKLVRN